MPKHDEDGGDIGEKNIGGQLGLVRVDLTQRPIKITCINIKNIPFASVRADQRPTEIVNKIENELVSLKNITSVCCGDRGQSRNVRQLHSPMQLKPLEGGGLGGSWCLCFFMCCLFVVVGRLWDVGCGFGVYSTCT